jgi:hypothetical protein
MWSARQRCRLTAATKTNFHCTCLCRRLILSVFGRLEELAHVESSDIAHAKYLRKSSQKWSVRQHVLHAHCGEGTPTFAAHSVVPLAKHLVAVRPPRQEVQTLSSLRSLRHFFGLHRGPCSSTHLSMH